MLLLLLLLALGLLRRLSMAALLHSFALGARFICLCSTGGRRDGLASFGWRLALFTRSHGRRRTELLRRRALLVALRWSLFQPTTRRICLFARTSCRLPALALLLRRCSLQG